MALLYTEEQKELIALVRDMAEHEIKPFVQEADEKGECPRELLTGDLRWASTCWRFRPSTAERV